MSILLCSAVERFGSVESSFAVGLDTNDERGKDDPSHHPVHGGERGALRSNHHDHRWFHQSGRNRSQTEGTIRIRYFALRIRLVSSLRSGYKVIVSKQHSLTSDDVQRELCRYLPQVTVETDLSEGGDVVFRTSQPTSDQLVQALKHLESMKAKNQIRSYGVQNSSLEDVFRKLTEGTTSNQVDDDRIGKKRESRTSLHGSI